MALIYCPECGTQTSDQALACGKCSYPIAKLNFSQAQNNGTNLTNSTNPKSKISDIQGLHYYYVLEFEQIEKSKERYKGEWNWYAFWFSSLWCLTKGLWGFAVVIVVIAMIVSATIASTIYADELAGLIMMLIVSLFFCILMGARGTWFYYNLKVKNKQFPS